MAGQKKRKRKNSIWEVLRILIMLAALIVLFYSAYRLYEIYHGYHAAGEEYSKLADEFTSPVEDGTPQGGGSEGSGSQGGSEPKGGESTAEDESTVDEEEETRLIEDAVPPLTVDWNALKAVNSDIIGWIYVDAEPVISYPICQGSDNSYYLHKTFRREDLFAGAIFADYMNSPDFSDPNTIVYGHNMKNGSMFGMLKFLREQATYDSAPYFWILTPEGNYRYHIYAAMSTPLDSEVYTFFEGRGEEFAAWEKRMQAASDVKNDVTFSENDFTVTLSTCTSDSSLRCVVLGKLVSTDHP